MDTSMHLSYVDNDLPQLIDTTETYCGLRPLSTPLDCNMKKSNMNNGVNIVDDDDDDNTELLSSFASMMVSSIETLGGESNWYLNHNSSLSSSSNALQQSSSHFPSRDVGGLIGNSSNSNHKHRNSNWLYHLHKNHHYVNSNNEQSYYEMECLGYVQCHAFVSCVQDIPVEIAVVSGKCICYIQTTWISAPTSTTNFSTNDTFILHHPLIVEALESLFVPVAIIPPPPQSSTSMTQQHQLKIVSMGFIDTNYQNYIAPITYDELIDTTNSGPILGTAMVYVLNKNEQSVPLYLVDMAKINDVTQQQQNVGVASINHHSACIGAVEQSPSLERKAWFGFHDTVPTASDFLMIKGITMFNCGSIQNVSSSPPMIEVRYNFREVCYSTLIRHVLTNLASQKIIIYCSSNDERMAVRLEIAKLKNIIASSTNTISQNQQQIAIAMVSSDTIFVPQQQEQASTKTNDDYDDINLFAAIRHTPLRFVPMTESQTTRINEMIQIGQYDQVIHLLSPRQVSFLKTVVELSNNSNDSIYCSDVVGYPILDAWLSVMEKKPLPQRQRKVDGRNNCNSSPTMQIGNSTTIGSPLELELYNL